MIRAYRFDVAMSYFGAYSGSTPLTPRSLERVKLQVEVLFSGGDADIADFHSLFSYYYRSLIIR